MSVKLQFSSTQDIQSTPANVAPPPPPDIEEELPEIIVPIPVPSPVVIPDAPSEPEKKEESGVTFMDMLKHFGRARDTDKAVSTRYCIIAGLVLLSLFVCVAVYRSSHSIDSNIEVCKLDYNWNSATSALVVTIPSGSVATTAAFNGDAPVIVPAYRSTSTQLVYILQEQGDYCFLVSWKYQCKQYCGLARVTVGEGAKPVSGLADAVATKVRSITDPKKVEFVNQLSAVYRDCANKCKSYYNADELLSDIRNRCQTILGFNSENKISEEYQWQQLFGVSGTIDAYLKDSKVEIDTADWKSILTAIADGLERGIK